jgi:ribosome-binding protein aMBF1 (putative translation factor)
MPRRHRLEKDAFDYTYERFIGSDPVRRAGYEAALARAELAMMLYEHRKAAGLTQTALAERAGTTASVVSRIEDADYEGHSLSLLRRIAAAMGRKVEIRLVEEKPKIPPGKAKRKRSAA